MAYKRLGDYIREVNVRNRDEKVTKPMGINIDKHFMPSVANVIGTDLSTYKLVSKNQFACNLMHVGRDEKIPMAIQTEDKPIIVSPAYFVFEIAQTNKLLPEYLMMWFRRPEFDRNAWFYTDADVRGGMDKRALLDMTFPIPSIERQREIVEEYETLSRRIRLNEQMIQKLEATAQALYRKMFVDNINKENLPAGWRMGTLGEVADIKGGKRLPKGEELQTEKSSHPYIKVADMCNYKYVILNNEIQYVNDDVQKQIHQYIVNTDDIILSIVGTIGNVNVIDESLNGANLTENCVKLVNLRSISNNYLYSFLVSKEGKSIIEQSIVGGVQGKLPIYNIEKMELLIPSERAVKDFNLKMSIINTDLKIRLKDNTKLTELQSLLLAKMGQ
ncbi:MAG: restriction endonuclease subunit S [Prevotella sp.]|nr:restriction endonuclease subunit S [Prevotella sp.]